MDREPRPAERPQAVGRAHHRSPEARARTGACGGNRGRHDGARGRPADGRRLRRGAQRRAGAVRGQRRRKVHRARRLPRGARPSRDVARDARNRPHARGLRRREPRGLHVHLPPARTAGRRRARHDAAGAGTHGGQGAGDRHHRRIRRSGGVAPGRLRGRRAGVRPVRRGGNPRTDRGSRGGSAAATDAPARRSADRARGGDGHGEHPRPFGRARHSYRAACRDGRTAPGGHRCAGRGTRHSSRADARAHPR